MLGPHIPPPPLGSSEARPAPCPCGIPDGSYRCLALEAEESGGEEGLPGDAGLTDLEEDRAASRREDDFACATQGAPQLPRGLDVRPPSRPGEVPQREDRATRDWHPVKAREVVVAGPSRSPSPSPGSKAAQKPALGQSLTEKDRKEAKAWSQQIAAQLTTPPSSNSRGVQLFNRRRQRVNEFTSESHGRSSGQKPGREPFRAPPAPSPSHAPGLGLSPTSRPEPGPPRNPDHQSPDLGVLGPSMEGCSEEEASLLRHLEKVASEEEEVPLVVYLKENAALLTANGLHRSQTWEAPASPPPAEVPSPAADVNQNLPSHQAALSSLASNSGHGPLAADANQNPPAPVTPLASTPQNSSAAQRPPGGTSPDPRPPAQAAEVGSSSLFGDQVSAPPAATSTFCEDAAPVSSCGSSVPAPPSSSLLADAQPGAPGGSAAATPAKLYSEVHLTLAKPPSSVVNRTARPFGIQAAGGPSQVERSPLVERRYVGDRAPIPPQAPAAADRSPRPQRHVMATRSPMLARRPAAQRSPALERRPLGNFAPPPTYAETLSTAPPASRVRGPPSYAALYPSCDPKLAPPRGAAAPAGKTGILEESAMRRGSRKAMFTFVEKPKVTPNPDLLDLVQTADEKRRQREQGDAAAEDEPFALGAEASNFQAEPPRDRAAADDAQVPEWASCLKSPRVQAKPKPRPSQTLPEASGKGAELYARRQSRMEKYVVESSGHAELARCPSPTMSLPSSWKYSASAQGGFRVAALSPARTPPASLYPGCPPENGVPGAPRPEPARPPPYQLRSSLFVLAPPKEPARAPPRAAAARAASPAKPSSLDLAPGPPRAALPPSPALPRSSRSSPSLCAPPGLDGLQPAAVSPACGGGDISPASPSRAWSPRARQAPRPSFSTRSAGIEAQVWKPSFCFK